MTKNRTVHALLIIVGVISGCVGDYSATTTQVSKIIPATYAFVIWLPIYVGGLYLAYLLLRDKSFDLGVASPWIAISYFMSGTWVRVQDFVNIELVAIGITLIVVLIQGKVVNQAIQASERKYVITRIASGLLAGWLTLASAVATSDALGISYKSTATVAIYVAFSVGFAVASATWIVPTMTYRLTLVWGLVGIIVQQHAQATQVAIVATVGVTAVVAMIAVMKQFNRTDSVHNLGN